VVFLIPACAEKEVEIPLSEVPSVVLAAAQDTLPGIEITEAEVEQEENKTVYELEGKLGDITYEMEIDAQGKILEVEKAGDQEVEDETGAETRE
jgi:uncharacterized membrane protein YkoI